jgi:hypothetical protein
MDGLFDSVPGAGEVTLIVALDFQTIEKRLPQEVILVLLRKD